MAVVDDEAVLDAIGDVAALDRLLSEGGNPDACGADGRTALEVAIESDDVASLRRLIAAGAHINAARQGGWTALHMAVDFEGDCSVQNGLPMDLRHIQPLLDAGADPTALWIDGRPPATPLDMARRYGHVAAINAMERVLREG